MSQENVELTRRYFEAWNAGDMGAVGESYDPHVVVRYAEDWPEGSEPIMGREAVMRQWEQQREPFDADTLELIEIIDLGDRVVTRFTWRAVGSGPDLKIEVTSVTTLRKGKTILVEFFWDHVEALEAVGLSEQATSQENVEIVRQHFADTNARRFDTALLAYDPNVELVVSEDVAVDPGVYRGVDAVGGWFGSWFSTFASDYRMDFAELIPVDDAVVAAVDHHGVGRSSGVEVTTRYYNAYWLQQGKIVRLAVFRNRTEALEAVGLSEQDAHADS